MKSFNRRRLKGFVWRFWFSFIFVPTSTGINEESFESYISMLKYLHLHKIKIPLDSKQYQVDEDTEVSFYFDYKERSKGCRSHWLGVLEASWEWYGCA